MRWFEWWGDEHNREGAVALSNVLKIVVPAVIAVGAVVGGYFYAKDEAPGPVVGRSIAATGDGQVQAGGGVQVRTRDDSPVTVGGLPGEGGTSD